MAGPYRDDPYVQLDLFSGCTMEQRCLSYHIPKKEVEQGVQARGYCRRCEIYLSIQFEQQRARRRMREAAELEIAKMKRAVKVR